MRLAISTECKNKPTDENLRKVNTTFNNVDISSRELASHVALGYAFCAEHRNGKRSSANFSASGVLAVDVDAGVTVQEALSHSFVQNHCSFIYTTVSHSEDEHRFRLVFELETPITDSAEMKRALTGLVAKLGGDRACTDACRMFFGNANTTITFVDKRLSSDAVAELVIFGAEFENARMADPHRGVGPRPTIRSRLRVEADQLITVADGSIHALKDLPKKTRVHCPVHVDTRPSAFTVVSKRGVPGVHCVVCGATFFSAPGTLHYDFDYTSHRLRSLGVTPWEAESEWEPDSEALVETSGGTATVESGLYVINERFLPPFHTTCEVVFVKSPKGSGKTEWLRQVVDDAKRTKKRVLLIGHRTSLIQSTARRLGLTAYFRLDGGSGDVASTKTVIAPKRLYAVCLDSLPTRLDTMSDRYDLVIIDEVEQVLAHMTSDTLIENRRAAISALSFYLKKASQIILLDADLNEVTFSCIPSFVGPRERSLVVINEWCTPRGDIHLYENDKQLVALLMGAVSEGKRCFVCANSKSRVDSLAMSIREAHPDKLIIAITSDNSSTNEAQTFLLGLPESFLRYDVVLVSPAVGTGVDVTFENNAELVDAVFGFFSANITTHFDIDQQLCRVRHPAAVHVWVSPQTFNFETDQSILRQELLGALGSRLSGTIRRDVVDIDDDGKPVYSKADELYSETYSEVMASQRASKNNLRYHFVELRKHSGWNIVEVPTDDAAIEEGKELAKHGADLAKEEAARRLCAAPKLTTGDYKALKKRADHEPVSDRDVDSLHRYELEQFYRDEISEELIASDDSSNLRRKSRLFDSLHATQRDVELKQSYHEEALGSDTYNYVDRRRMLIDLFAMAGVFEDGSGFDRGIELTQTQLGAFVEMCRNAAVKAKIERLLDVEVARDASSKPVQQLGRFLALVGLGLRKSRTERDGKSKIYYYRIDADRLSEMTELMERRGNQELHNEWLFDRASFTRDEDAEAERAMEDIRTKRTSEQKV